MRRPAGIETEYGLNCEGFPGAPGGAAGGAGPGLPGGAAIDFAYECSRLVRAADVPGAFRGWDYQGEDPYRDLRGMRVERLARDPHDLQGPSDRSRHLSREELLANTVLLNGARFYNDHNHPEYCTEACLSLLDLVAQDKAGERVLFACEGRRNAELAQEVGPGTRVRVLKNNTDYHGRTYGMHENYLFPRSIPLETVIRATIPFFVTRQIFCGAGKVGIETSGGDVQPGFQLSQRADFFEERIGINTTAQRPLFNTRDEPHADKGQVPPPARHQRGRQPLRVGHGDEGGHHRPGAGPDRGRLDPAPRPQRPGRGLQAHLPRARPDGHRRPLRRAGGAGGGRAAPVPGGRRAQRCAGRDSETDWVLQQWRGGPAGPRIRPHALRRPHRLAGQAAPLRAAAGRRQPAREKGAGTTPPCAGWTWPTTCSTRPSASTRPWSSRGACTAWSRTSR